MSRLELSLARAADAFFLWGALLVSSPVQSPRLHEEDMGSQGTDPNNARATSRVSGSQASVPVSETIQADIIDGLRTDIMQFHSRAICESGHDIRGIIGTIRKFEMPVRECTLPANSERATPPEVATALSEIGRSVFLPRHEVLDVRLLGDRYEVISGRIDLSSYASLSYLGREIKTAQIRFTHGIENSMGLSIDTMAMIDPHLIRLDCNIFFDRLETLSQVNPFARELHKFITLKRVTKHDYCKVAGLERLLKEEVQHAKDAIFIDRITNEQRKDSGGRHNDALLKPESRLRAMLKFDHSTSNLGSVGISEYSSALGGIIMELEQYIAKQQWDAAKLAVLDFLTQQSFRAVVQRGESIGVIYHIGAKALFEGFEQLMPDVRKAPSLVSRLFAGSTPQQQVQRCRKIFTELHNRDLYADWERQALISAKK